MTGNSLFLLAFLCTSTLMAHSKIYYVAPNGNDNNAGTITAPFLTIQRSQTAVTAGDTVYIRGGTYMMQESQIAAFATVGTTKFAYVTNLTKSGTSGNRIRYWAYPGERPVFNYTNVRPADHRINAFEVSGSWIHIKGLEVVGVQVTIAQNINTQSICFSNNATNAATGGSNNIYELLSMHDGMAIGFYLTRGGNNLVLNCDAYNNFDSVSGDKLGGNVDGFGSHPNRDTYTGNVFRGCRAWFNSDDGYDCISAFAATTFENCWAMYNGYSKTFRSLANGIGFKAGGYGVSTSPSVPAVIPRNIVRNCLAVQNKSSGFYANHHPGGIDWFNNTAYRNSTNYNMLNRSTDYQSDVPGYGHVIRNNVSLSPRSANSHIINYDAAKSTIDHNTFLNPSVSLSSADFISLDTALLRQPRLPNGDLPVNGFMRLAPGSDLIDAGINVGLPYVGSAPDLGYREFSSVLPTVSGSTRLTPADSTTLSDSLTYRVTFSEVVINVDTGDFALTATGEAAGMIASVTPLADGKTYDVGVKVLSRGGTLRLDVRTTATIRNIYNNSMTGGFTLGERYTLLKNGQSITFPALGTKMVGDPDFDPGATSSSGLPVTYTSSDASVAIIVGGMIHIVGTGTTEITASQEGNNNFNAAAPVTQTLTVKQGFYHDYDRDTYGNPETLITDTISPGTGWVTAGGDCNDKNSNVHPGAPERPDNVDNDCNGLVDEGLTLTTFYQDYDRDTYGNSNATIRASLAPVGYTGRGGDCNDKNSDVYPEAPEIADNLDNDCDGTVDDGLALTTFYHDYDRDGYGNNNATIRAGRSPGPGWVTMGGDCNDKKNRIHPGASEILNGMDDNCNGQADEGLKGEAAAAETAEEGLASARIKVGVAPNPSNRFFTLSIGAKDDKPVQIRVLDLLGNLLEQKLNVLPNATLQIGQSYPCGVYVVEVRQGMERAVLKLVKQQ